MDETDIMFTATAICLLCGVLRILTAILTWGGCRRQSAYDTSNTHIIILLFQLTFANRAVDGAHSCEQYAFNLISVFVCCQSEIADIPRMARQMDTTHESTMGSSRFPSSIVFIANIHLPRMVHCDICIGDLPFKFIYSVFNAKNRSSFGSRWCV